MQPETKEKKSFSDLGVTGGLLDQLNKLNFLHPTPIQDKAIPVASKGRDVIGIAQTGTGKTLAFTIPMIQQLASGEGKGLVVLPTRELAHQVQEEMHKIGAYFGMKTALLIGGASAHLQQKQLQKKPNIIIATPGRLIDHLEQGNVKLHDVKTLVLDEADRMLDMGFEPQIRKVLSSMPNQRQTMLFSATMPEAIKNITHKYMQKPETIQVSRPGESAKKIKQEAYIVSKYDKLPLLLQLLEQTTGPVIVFTRTKFGAKKLTKQLRGYGHAAAEIHSNRSQNQRKVALAGFKNGTYRILAATDIAARGIDVKNIELVVNMDLPEQLDDYVHRIGRTGRAGSHGKAVSFVQPNQKRDLKRIERLVKKTIPIIKTVKDLELPKESDKPFRDPNDRPGGGRGRGGYRGSGGSRSGGGSGRRSSGGRSGGSRSSSGRSSEGRSSSRRSRGGRSGDSRSSSGRPSGGRSRTRRSGGGSRRSGGGSSSSRGRSRSGSRMK